MKQTEIFINIWLTYTFHPSLLTQCWSKWRGIVSIITQIWSKGGGEGGVNYLLSSEAKVKELLVKFGICVSRYILSKIKV